MSHLPSAESPPEGPHHHGPRVDRDPRAPRGPSDLVRELVIGPAEGSVYRTRGGRFWYLCALPSHAAPLVSPDLYRREIEAVAALIEVAQCAG